MSETRFEVTLRPVRYGVTLQEGDQRLTLPLTWRLRAESKSTPSKSEVLSRLEQQRCVCVFRMSSDRVIIDAIKIAQNLLWQNLPPAHNLTDAATVMRFRELVRSQAIRSALERSSDTLLAFTLRAVEREISDQSRTNRETINRLWDVLDDPHLNQALGLPQSRMIRR
jgi:hypothetical protein